MDKPVVIVGIVPEEKLQGHISLEELKIIVMDCLHLGPYLEVLEPMIVN
jgi:hypothetical protein